MESIALGNTNHRAGWTASGERDCFHKIPLKYGPQIEIGPTFA
jgi:hypothetical protein